MPRRVRTNRKFPMALSLVSSALFAIACGGSDASVFPTGGNSQDNTVSGPSGSFDDGGTSSNTVTSTKDACVSSTSQATLKQVNLVFMYDRSGSMGDLQNVPPYDPNLKWNPVGSGMTAFFSDPGSKTLNASLQFFPSSGDMATICAANYTTPKVALTSVADASAFTSAISGTKPQGGTPTLPALQGAVDYAKQVAAQHPDQTSAIVLVTDGEPGFTVDGKFVAGCPNNDIAHVSALAADTVKSAGISTYVIGVGPSLNNLNQIATAGGTQQAYMVSVDDPTKTAATFQQALDAVRGKLLSCDFPLPAPPEGKTLDVQAVNVAYSSHGGAETVLSYNNDCANGVGWHYDDINAPTRIQLCQATCDTARSDAKGALTVAFGCRTNGVIR